MKFGLLIILIALLVVMVLYLGKGPKANPVSQSLTNLDKAKAVSLEPILLQVEAALAAYADENGSYPDDLENLVPRCLPRTDLLVDPWGTRLRLEKDDQQNSFLICAGPDRIFATGDDSRRSL
ncbi:MAG: hypothetical protein MUP71_04140 [Candidatus Aminicenantes bacterium]|nr:hypothetical protein [Candidatus Aminicenantes bacterium]